MGNQGCKPATASTDLSITPMDGSLQLPATLMRQILLNLLLNAEAAEEEGGVRLVVESASNSLHLAVTDDGDYFP